MPSKPARSKNLISVIEDSAAPGADIRITETTLSDGSTAFGVWVRGLGEFDCLDEKAANTLANCIEGQTNLQFDGWSPIKRTA